MSIKNKINEDMKTALKAHDKKTLSVLRMMLSEIKYAQSAVNMKEDLDEDTITKVVAGYHKKLTKALDDFPEGEKRMALLEEIKIVENYLPKRATSGEIEAVINKILAESDDRQFGSLMKKIMTSLGATADGKMVSQILKSKLP